MDRRLGKTRTTYNRGQLNIVLPPTHPHTTNGIDIRGLGVVTLQRPKPAYDKVTVSVWCQDDLFDMFVEKFGRPRPWSRIGGYFNFENGVFLSRWQKWDWWSIIFKLDKQTIAELYPIFDDLPPRFIGKMDSPEDYRKIREEPAVLLQEAEIAFDIILPEMRYITQAEPLLHDIAAIIIPKRQNSRVHPYPFDKSKRKREKLYDGTVNGKVTYYIDKLEEQEHGNYIKIENPSVDVKMYLKLLPRALDWVLRLEVTLQKDALYRRIGKELPNNVRVNTDGRDIQIEDFVQFARFDWKSFDADFERICVKKLETFQEECKRLRRYARRNKTITSDMLDAIQIAKFLTSRRLKERIKAGKYYIPVNLFEE
jgi:hypothetical protein